MKKTNKILIVHTGGLGDILMARPAISALRRDNFNAQIDFLGSTGSIQVLANDYGISRLISFPSSPKNIINSSKVLAKLAELHLRRYDVLYLFQPILNKESCRRLRFLVKFINARESIGRQNNFGGDFVNLVVPENAGLHEVERIMSVAQTGSSTFVAATEFCLPLTICNSAEAGKAINGSYVVLSPGGNKESRRWPAENFIELSHRFSDSGLETVFVGDKTEKGILSGKEMRLPLRAKNLMGSTDLQELCAIIKAARIVVANDSGPMHLANALSVSVVGIFGSGDAARTRPYLAEKSRIVDSPPMACKPCYSDSCGHRTCMDDITIDRVWETITELMQSEK